MLTAIRSVAASFVVLFASALCRCQTLPNDPYIATRKEVVVEKNNDGTTTTHESTSFEARDSAGRVMRRTTSTTDGQQLVQTIIVDPAAHTTTIWDSPGNQGRRIHTPDPQTRNQQAALPISLLMMATLGHPAVFPAEGKRPETKFEVLPGKTIDGIYVVGNRTTEIYPAGTIGNDQPIVQMHESWTTPDQHLAVENIDSGPRFTLTRSLVSIDRTEPDPALFQAPQGYMIEDQYSGTN